MKGVVVLAVDKEQMLQEDMLQVDIDKLEEVDVVMHVRLEAGRLAHAQGVLVSGVQVAVEAVN